MTNPYSPLRAKPSIRVIIEMDDADAAHWYYRVNANDVDVDQFGDLAARIPSRLTRIFPLDIGGEGIGRVRLVSIDPLGQGRVRLTFTEQ